MCNGIGKGRRRCDIFFPDALIILIWYIFIKRIIITVVII